jgi:serine/threonine protein phosphatase PrpC
VVEAVGESFAGAPPGDPERSWVEAVEAALHALASRGREEPELAGMATTLVGLLLLPGQEDWAGSCANIGDSRLYRFRAGEVRRITTDHTVPQDLLRVGTITADEASAHPLSHVLTRALSADAPAEPEVISLRAAPGDRFLLCSDGVTASMEDGELAGLAGETAPDEFALELVHQANARGGQDNATALVVDLPEGRM